jgi:hypothetical protein
MHPNVCCFFSATLENSLEGNEAMVIAEKNKTELTY